MVDKYNDASDLIFDFVNYGIIAIITIEFYLYNSFYDILRVMNRLISTCCH